MRGLILGIVLGLAGCHVAPVACEGHLSPINRTVSAGNAASSAPGLSAPRSGVSR